MIPAMKEVKMTYSQWNILRLFVHLPVEDVENTIEAHEQYVMSSDVLNIPDTCNHAELWEN